MAATEQGRRVEALAGLVALTFIAVGCIIVLGPFLTALAWALILVFVTWPLYLRIQRLVGGRPTVAAALMTVVLAVALLIPMFAVGSGLTESAIRSVNQVQGVIAAGLPEPPAWLADIPVIGPDLAKQWNAVDDARIADTAHSLIGPASQWVLRIGGRIGSGLIDLTLSVLAAFFFYRDGAAASIRLTALAQRLGGERAHRLMRVAEGTTKGVVYGVIGTALAQATLAAIGLWIAGIPAWLFLGFITFFVSIVPPGAPLIWLPATAWLVYNDQIGWAIFMGIWGFFVVSGIDNFLKPYFISRGSAMPLLLVLLGVFGGALAFGFLGVFLGPIFLAVGYTLVREWSAFEAPPGDGAVLPAPPAAVAARAPHDDGNARSGV